VTPDNWGRLILGASMFLLLVTNHLIHERAERNHKAVLKEQEKLFERMLFVFDNFVALSKLLRERDKRTETGERVN